MSQLQLLTLLFAVSFLLTHLFRRLALRQHWFDIPNDRSSHQRPTPKGGGVAFVLAFSGAILLALSRDWLAGGAALALLMGLPVALMGLFDDFRNLPVRLRLAGQLAAALAVLLLAGGLPALPLFGLALDFAWAGYGIGALGLVWLINLYNFMDGIDGLAALEAIFVCLAAAFLAWRQGQTEPVFLLLALAAAVGGFLLLNLPPAGIFMGDTGSNFLGLTLGGLGLLSIHGGAMTVWTWAILLGVFIVDSTLTLGCRVKRGELFWAAHRSHAYQHAARRWRGHGKVDSAVMVLNLAWLFPLAWLSQQYPQWGITFTIIAYTPLIFLGKLLNAGTAEAIGNHGFASSEREPSV